MYLLLRVNKKIKIKENVVFVYVSLINQEHISDAFDGKFTQEW